MDIQVNDLKLHFLFSYFLDLPFKKIIHLSTDSCQTLEIYLYISYTTLCTLKSMPYRVYHFCLVFNFFTLEALTRVLDIVPQIWRRQRKIFIRDNGKSFAERARRIQHTSQQIKQPSRAGLQSIRRKLRLMAAVAGNLPPFPQRLRGTAVFKPPKALASFEHRYCKVCFSVGRE